MLGVAQLDSLDHIKYGHAYTAKNDIVLTSGSQAQLGLPHHRLRAFDVH